MVGDLNNPKQIQQGKQNDKTYTARTNDNNTIAISRTQLATLL